MLCVPAPTFVAVAAGVQLFCFDAQSPQLKPPYSTPDTMPVCVEATSITSVLYFERSMAASENTVPMLYAYWPYKSMLNVDPTENVGALGVEPDDCDLYA